MALALVPAIGQAAIKDGGSCKKLGSSTTTNSGITYKCSKSGSKKVWRFVKSATPAPSATPSRIATGNFGELDPTKAMRIVMSEFVAFPKATGDRANVTIIRGPNVGLPVYEFFAAELKSASDFFAGRFVKSVKRTFFIGNEEDAEFVAEEVIRLGDVDLAARIRDGKARMGKNFSSAQAGERIGLILSNSNIDISSLKYNYSDLGVHEFAHMYQYEKTPASQQSGWETFGCLWTEGHAEFIAQYRAWKSEAALEGFRNYYFNRDIKRDYGLVLDSREKVIDYLKASEDVAKSRCKGMYSIGTIVLEGLVAVHGLEKVHDFYLGISSGVDRSAAFRNIFGLSVDDFYTQISDYVLKVQRKYGVI